MPRARVVLRWVGPALFTSVGWLPILLASEPLWLLGGSDAGSCCVQASLWAQLLAWGCVAGAWVWRALAPQGAAQLACLVTAACGYLLSLHGLCSSVERQAVFEHWAGLRLRGLPLDPADGELSFEAGALFIEATVDGQKFSVFRGIPPWWIPNPGECKP
jgi:hypothetical protein